MAIIDNMYQDKIMGGLEGDPLTNISNQFAISGPGMDQGFVNQYNLEQRFNPMFYSDNQPEIPGFNFIDAPIETSFFKRMTDPAFKPYRNNPRTGIIDNFLMQKGNPGNTIIDKAKSGIGKGIDLGKTAIGGIASLVTGIPGLGLLLGAFGRETPEEKAMRDFYGSQFGLTDTGQIASGIMQGYNPVSLTSFGLSNAIDKRIARIKKTLQKRKSETLEQRIKDLEALKAKEAAAAAAALEKQRIGRRPGTGGGPPGTTGIKDTAASQGFSPGQAGAGTGGYSYDAGGREGFGYGLKKGGLIGLL